MSTCFFIGHRDVSDSVLPALEQEVERHITEYGITDFVVGHYGRFDSLTAQALSRAKVRHPEIRLTLLLPYHPAEHPFPKPESFDHTFYPPNMEHVPRRLAIIRANQYMVNNSTHLTGRHPLRGLRPGGHDGAGALDPHYL